MIGTSTWEYVFIISCIVLLHSIAPLSLIYCAYVACLAIPKSFPRLPVPLECWLVAEALFYLVVFLPHRRTLQNAATHPTTIPREERRKLFDRCHDTVQDPELYLSKWFKHSKGTIKRDDVKIFFCWAFLNKASYGPEDDEELDEYGDKMEQLLGRKLEPGSGGVVPLLLTLDKVNMMHRSLTWYFVRPPHPK